MIIKLRTVNFGLKTVLFWVKMKTHFVCQSMRILGIYNFGTHVNEGKKIERSRGSSRVVICKTSFSCRRCLPLSLALRNLNCKMKHKDIPLIIFYVDTLIWDFSLNFQVRLCNLKNSYQEFSYIILSLEQKLKTIKFDYKGQHPCIT